MQLDIDSVAYEVVAAYGPLTIPDSFVIASNKIGTGNGERKLYVGNESDPDLQDFFGPLPIRGTCFLRRSDLVKYLEDTAEEYRAPEQPYRQAAAMPQLLIERRDKVHNLPEMISFTVNQTQTTGPRVYLTSRDQHYELLRELSLPNLTKVAILKLRGPSDRLCFYFRLFADYFGQSTHPAEQQTAESEIDSTVRDPVTREALRSSRTGQGRFRTLVLQDCGRCPITLIGDDRLLVASHIKPWIKSDNNEKLDPKNGLMLTPTYDRLFDRGFIAFGADKSVILSPWISQVIYAKLGLIDGKVFPHLPVEGREDYLAYHYREVFKR